MEGVDAGSDLHEEDFIAVVPTLQERVKLLEKVVRKLLDEVADLGIEIVF